MHKTFQNLILKAFYFLPILGIFLASFNSWQPYSYWLDELYSVTTSSLGFSEMFRAMLHDVHPPLYQLLLWVWIKIFGDNELITRGFSLICSLSALVYIYFWSNKRFDKWSQFITLTFFSTSWLFTYYAQETRSYALLLFLSTLLIGQFISDDKSIKSFFQIICISILLGSVHYFGLILCSAVLLWLAIQNISNLKRISLLIATGILLIIWPLVEYFYGTLENKTGGNFWIQVDGPTGTLAIFFQAMVTLIKLNTRLDIISAIFVIGIVLVLLAHRIYLNKNKSINIEKIVVLKLIFCLTWVICVVTIIDTHTPISTERNFIALLPVVSILIGIALGDLIQFRFGLMCIIAIVSLWSKSQLEYSYNLLSAKWTPLQNWKLSANYLVNHANSEKHLFYLKLSDSEEVDRVFNFYVNRFSKKTLNVEPIYASMLKNISSPSLVLVGGAASNTIDQIVSSENVHIKNRIYPRQTLQNSTGVLIFE